MLAAIVMQTGSCGVFLSAGSSTESGRGGRIDGEKRELEEEEAVGEERAGQGRLLLPVPWGCQGKFELLPGATDSCLSLRGSFPSSLLWEQIGHSIFSRPIRRFHS